MASKKAILGKKVGMTRLFRDNGEIVPVTIVQAGPCYVTQVKTTERDGYVAVQIGFGHSKRLNRPQLGHLGELPPLRHLREFRIEDASEYQVGQAIDVSVFAEGELVDVVGTSKGRGFAGAMKRHGFKGGPATHGQSDRARATGSVGAGSTPGRTFKGMRGPGHMGNRRVTVLSLEVVKVYPERNLLAIRGGVPGARNGLLFIRNAVKPRKVPKSQG